MNNEMYSTIRNTLFINSQSYMNIIYNMHNNVDWFGMESPSFEIQPFVTL